MTKPSPNWCAITPIEGEKFGGGRYIASLTARFKPDGVRSLLRRAEILFAETASQPILVLPVFQTAGASSLWDDPNPWYTAWAGLPRSDGLLPLVIPVGDLSDVAVIGAEQAVQGQAERLIEIGSKYDARNVMVVTATLRISPGNGALALETLSSVNHDGEARQTTIRRFDSVPGQSRDDLLAGAAAALSVEANESWKRDNLLDEGSASNMAVRVPLSGLDNWLDIRGKLRGIAVHERSGRRSSIDLHGRTSAVFYREPVTIPAGPCATRPRPAVRFAGSSLDNPVGQGPLSGGR